MSGKEAKEAGDHPRLRGEQIRAAILSGRDAGSPPLARGTACGAGMCARCSAAFPVPGSPPLARGTGSVMDGEVRYKGITPACAGNRLKKDLLYLVFYNIVFHFSISFS